MLATQCSFCKHENVPGARFCADCGSPMHLKVCGNAQCGKVSDVSATVCESCGQPFPKINVVAAGTTGTESVATSKAKGSEPATKQGIPAWPLLMVALVAGGLPMLWANRSKLPTPQTWQSTPSSAPKPSAPSAAPTAVAPAPTVAVPPAPAPVPAKESTSSDVAQAKPAQSIDSVDEQQPSPPIKGDAPKKKAKTPPPKKSEPPRPCTEAVAALGLCGPNSADR